MHSQALARPPKTPQADHSCPISAHEPLPTQRFFFEGTLEGHDPAATHWPLQTTEGASQIHVVGLLGGKAVNPSVQLNSQEFPLTQAGVLWSG